MTILHKKGVWSFIMRKYYKNLSQWQIDIIVKWEVFKQKLHNVLG